MLTGDKIETAACIAISAGIKTRNQKMYTIKDVEDLHELKQHLKQFDRVS